VQASAAGGGAAAAQGRMLYEVQAQAAGTGDARVAAHERALQHAAHLYARGVDGSAQTCVIPNGTHDASPAAATRSFLRVLAFVQHSLKTERAEIAAVLREDGGVCHGAAPQQGMRTVALWGLLRTAALEHPGTLWTALRSHPACSSPPTRFSKVRSQVASCCRPTSRSHKHACKGASHQGHIAGKTTLLCA